MPKRSDLVSGMERLILYHFLTIQSSDEEGIRVLNLCLRRKGSHKAMLFEQAG
jgi:hypothetical protein